LTGQNLVQEEAGIELFYNYEGWWVEDYSGCERHKADERMLYMTGEDMKPSLPTIM